MPTPQRSSNASWASSGGSMANIMRMCSQRSSACGKSIAPATSRRYKQNQGFATVRVFYGTNRARSGETKPALFYGKGRGDLQYGYLNVTIPQIHKEAELETQPRWAEYIFDLTGKWT